jgi:hypothetical protein
MTQDDRERARDAAAVFAGALVDERSRSLSLGRPLLVRAPHGAADSWFVPLVDDDELAGFVQLGLDLGLRRASWLRAPAASWLDRDTIRGTARRAAGAADAERLGEPVLSFDGSPDRLAWAVPVGDGEATIFVTGDYAWRSR